MSIPALDSAASPPWPKVHSAMNMLRAAADARNGKQAERLLELVFARAERSATFTNAAHLAAQVLRDADVLTRPEAIYVFTSLYELWQDKYLEADAAYQECLHRYVEKSRAESGEDPALLLDKHMLELTEIESAIQARFHRTRGEATLAHQLVHERDALHSLMADGEHSLVLDVDVPARINYDQADKAMVAVVCERIAALAATETVKETLAMHHALHAELRVTDVPSGMAAVRALRDVGLVSFRESIELLTNVIDGLLTREMGADRQHRRLQAQLDAMHATAPAGYVAEEDMTADQRALTERYEARTRALLAMCLRRFGEHEAANLLVNNPEEFNRCETEISIGAWGVRG